MGRVLAIDWGKKRVGAAISDPTCTIAASLPTLEARPVKELCSRLRDIIDREGVSLVLVGYPKNMDGSVSSSAAAARRFGEKLVKPYRGKVALVLQDERLTSWSAKKMLGELGERSSKESGRIDQVVAASLLQDYLDSRRS